ncbi:MAG: 2-C-methyl-D-erythritol 4-phosphate cytidylyltransferase [Bacteroidota bacterium]|nr:2-C-methyl-D-erythritol 4-phosphate cytidylyltransferase [Bacteroidota bacterium]
MTKFYAIILAGGKGIRMNNTIPKQFLTLHGKPVLIHTIEKFASISELDIEIIVVLAKEQKEQWKTICNKHNFSIPHTIVDGGEERFYSVKNGLNAINEPGIVAIHDGVRPLVSKDVIIRSFKTAEERGSALPVIPITESIRKKKTDRTISVPRSKYIIVQTPQTFSTNTVIEAYKQKYSLNFTDDASVVESTDYNITLITGNKENIKLTTEVDFVIAEALLK